MSHDLRAEIAGEMERARAATLGLFDLVPRESDLHESPGFGFRPVIWHLAHIGVFEAYWLLQRAKGDPAPDERYERIFDPISTPREQSKHLPPRREMEDYLARVRARSLDYLASAPLDAGDRLLRDAYVFRLVLEHERQHQETLAYLLHLLDPAKKSRPRAAHDAAPRDARADDLSSHADESSSDDLRSRLDESSSRAGGSEMVSVPAGSFVMGAGGGVAFVYDNELPAHEVFVPEFRMARLPVTNAEFSEFIAEGGYARREWWDAEGWEWREREAWESPLYWSRAGASWRVRGMFADGELESDHPVAGVSWYEAAAYARFRGRRLPTEAEWEKAAAWDESARRMRLYAWGDGEPSDELCNFDLRRWGTTPAGRFAAGASAAGCLDMTGNVWEWTASKFAGYPGFRADPYPEYSEVWFDDDHRVLRGGSWATSPSVLRASFRNFFRRHFRIAFAGLRLAADA
jgi:iron(II)-dependent oxidoreductase